MTRQFRLLGVVTMAVVAWCASGTVSEAQTPVTGSISGYVTDENRKPLPGVTVTVRATDKTAETTVVTDAAGYYAFHVLEPSDYALRVTLAGFHDEFLHYGCMPLELVEKNMDVWAKSIQ